MLEDPLNANKVFEALYEHRWAFSAEEQDAHELFHVLTSTLDEESAAFPGQLKEFCGYGAGASMDGGFVGRRRRRPMTFFRITA